MDFGVLGPLTVGDGAGDISIGSKTQRTLLAALLVHARVVVSTDSLVSAVWRDDPPVATLQALYTYISRLRGLLHRNDDVALVTQPPGYVLRVEPEQIDAGRFERLLNHARSAATRPKLALASLDEALALWRGPAYAEFADEEFARSEAMRLDELRRSAMEERFDAALALGRHAGLVGEIEAYATGNPLRERPRAQLMLALYRCGRQAESLDVLRAFRQRLDEDLGVDPSAELRALETAILRQEAELDWTPPPEAVRDSVVVRVAPAARPARIEQDRGHRLLPAEISSLVGRDADTAAVAGALGAGRMVTLTGVGGVGKTRLAVHVGTRVADRYPDGALFCELEPVADGTAVGHAIATAIGARQQPDQTIEESLRAFLAPRELLLIVDNCEHVLDHTARLLQTVVRQCPRVTVLATSRIGLGVAGEHILPVAPLPVPEPDMEAVESRSPAVRLFIDRARAVRPDLQVTGENGTHIAQLCRQLDGLPLAIELAAARMRALNPADLVARIGDRFSVLTTAKPSVTPRHRSLRAVVDWSCSLLSPAEQRLFSWLSVFAGGFTLAAVEHVYAGDDSVDLIGALVDSSLVVASPTDGQVRYTMLETVRAYSRELLLQRGEADSAHRAHATYYAELAERAERGMRAPDEGRWAVVLNADLDNLRAAHRWAVDHGDVDLALRISAGLYHYGLYHLRDEVVAWAETALGLPGADAHPLYAEVCGALGEGLTLRGDVRRAGVLAERALDRVTDPTDHQRLPLLKVMTAVALYEGRLDDCITWAEEHLRLARSRDDAWHAAEALLFLGLAPTYAGDDARGLDAARENIRIARTVGNPSLIAWALYNEAEALAHTAPEQAGRHYRSAIALADSVGSTFASTIAEVGLAALLSRSGAYADALPTFRDIIDRWRLLQVWHHQWTTLRNLIQLLVRVDAHEDAAVLQGAMGAAETAAYGADADRLSEVARVLDEALGHSTYTAATARGASLTPDETVEFALSAIARAMR